MSVIEIRENENGTETVMNGQEEYFTGSPGEAEEKALELHNKTMAELGQDVREFEGLE